MKTYLTLTKRDQKGRIIETRTQPSRSWLLHFFHIWYILLGFNSNTLAGINDIGGTGRAMINAQTGLPNFNIGSPPGGAFFPLSYNHATNANSFISYIPGYTGEYIGIVVGTDNTAVAPDDDAMGVLIAHGEAAGELLYGGTLIREPTFAGANGSMIIRRFFENQSGGGITVEEVGIYAPAYVAANTAYSFCIARDLTGGVAVADTEILEVTYTVQITV